MYKKISLLKNVLKVIILGFVIFNMLKSCSMAYNIDDLYDYALQIQTMENVPSGVTYNANRIVQFYNRLKDYAVLQNAKSLLVQNTYPNVTILYYNDVYKISFNNQGNMSGLPATNGIYISEYGNFYNVNNVNFTQTQSSSFGLLDLSLNTKEEIQNFNWSAWYLNNRYDEPSHFLYTPYNITTIDDYNILKFNYVGNVGIGLLGVNDFYLLEARLKDSSLTTLGSALWNENQECYYRDNALLVEDNTRILVNTVYLSYYEPYYLEFTIYSDSTNYEINGYLYKFYPPNAVIENGQIVSAGSGDYTNQNQTIDIIGGVVGELPSGDSPGSGILGGIARLFVPSSDFFLNYFNNLNDWLTNHLGFIYTPFEIVINLFQRILTIDYSNPHVEIGPYTLPLNEDFELVPKITYYFNDLLENQKFKDVYDIYLVIVDGIIYTGFVYLCYCKYEEIIGGSKK